MEKFKKVLFIFKIVYMAYLLLAFNAFLNNTEWMNVGAYVITVWGAIMVLWMLIVCRKYLKAYNIWILAAFILSYAVSAVTHLSYGIGENIKGLIWLVLPILLLYLSAFELSRQEIINEFDRLSKVYIVLCSIGNFVSLTMYLWGRNLDYTDSAGTIHAIGYRWNRLWGIYDDPNHGATITIITLFMLLYFWSKTKKLQQKVLVIVLLVINYGYIVLSDSRTSLVSLAAGVVVYVVFKLWSERYEQKEKKYVVKKILSLMIVAGIVIIGTYGVKSAVQAIDKKITAVNEQNETKETTSSRKQNIQDDLPDTYEKITATQVQNETKETTSSRKQNLQDDYSNGRLEIWKSGLEIIQSSPVAGIGYRNMSAYAQENLPDTYIVNNPDDMAYDSMHNLEMDVLVSQGILGGIIFLCLLGNIVVIVIKKLPYIEKKYRKEAQFAITIAAVLGIAATFISFIFYVNAPQNYCFWLCLGYGMRLCQTTVEKEEV